MKIARRKFTKVLLRAALLLGTVPLLEACTSQPYTRPGVRYKLGQIKDFLYIKVFLRDKQLLISRFKTGWAAMSTKCTYEGCDLTFQEKAFFCPCCHSVFSHQGEVFRGPAKQSLPWVKVVSKGNDFFADTGSLVSSSVRYTTDEIEKVIKDYKFKFREIGEIDLDEVELPEIFKNQ